MRRLLLVALALAAAGTAFVYAQSGAMQTRLDNPAVSQSAKRPGQDRIWSAVVIARNVDKPKDPPPELKDFAPRLKRVFGYNQFELAGTATNPIGDRTESRLLPSPRLWLSVKARQAMSKEARGGYLLSLQLHQDQRQLVDTEAKLAPGSPLFMRGPAYGDGQVIIVLQIQR
ncbi:MAG TPA: hypothetical protein VGO90_16890 [Chthoniobacteraceae bacterium]|nr:hypothetical protein [Chthoniobacteraceae bacterium]